MDLTTETALAAFLVFVAVDIVACLIVGSILIRMTIGGGV